MNISDAAKRSGLSAKMIRYYESVGLLGGVGRSEAGYRDFDASDVALLSFIRWARELNLPVARIVQILRAMAHGEDAGPVLRAHAEEITRLVSDLEDKRTTVLELATGGSFPLTSGHLDVIRWRARRARQRLAWLEPNASAQAPRGLEDGNGFRTLRASLP
ncbi:MerR family transcriptional regulator [Tistrella mobilis]|uniref:MerR family transcriptional regulator n=1 Tax=Tistrella mobilis TaxID=171437 RepID=UPI00059F2A9E|nr:MerR family transcriptional regulator [Tistrella mobilis]